MIRKALIKVLESKLYERLHFTNIFKLQTTCAWLSVVNNV